jgi:diguanylate cyclase (GGDEF)-like protein
MSFRFDRILVEKHATSKAAIPAVLTLLMAAVLVTSLLIWSAARADAVSFERQEQLVSRALTESAGKLMRDQQGLMFKDNMVRLLANPIVTEADTQRMHNNAGPGLYKQFQHDESYVLDGDDRPLFAMRDGQMTEAEVFESLRNASDPLLASVRAQTRRLSVGQPLRSNPGAYDITVADGHPAIVSVKPVISHTGRVPQPPGREVLQISVLRLDGQFLQRLSHNYLLHGARFAWTDDRRAGEAARSFVSPRTKRVVGYFFWTPYNPGSIVMRDMIPPLLVTLLLIGTVVYFLLGRLHRSTAQLQASEAQAKHLAFHDVLTGLPNRAFFNDRLDRALAATRRNPDQACALLYLDLDRFKQVNDTLGHPAGDELIREVSRRLSCLTRETDTVARLGGDEFAIILTAMNSEEDIDRLCGRILAAVRQPFDLAGSQMFVGITIGVAIAPKDAHDRVEMTRKADIALYNAKAAGRDRYMVFEEQMDATIQVRQTIEQDLRAAIAGGTELRVYYQPLYDSASGVIAGAEALVRWDHPKKGMLCPATFIPIAEESGLIEPLGEWVLERACEAAIHWPIRTISVNISGVQLRNPTFARRVQKILRRTGLDPRRLELEITETSFIESVGECEKNIAALRSAGIQIALDDFGTGYSSFTHLHKFEVDRVKIDRSFVVGLGKESGGSAIIQAIVDLAQAAGLKITAEGVETDDQIRYLCSVGCDKLQGFLLSQPVPLEVVDKVLGVNPAVRRASGDQRFAA